MSYDVIKKKITYDDELCFNWAYKNVRDVKRLQTSFAIDKFKAKKWFGCKEALQSMVDGTAKYPIEIVNQDFGIITAYMKNDCLEFNIYDGDTYSEELENYFEDGIQQEIEFNLNKKQTKECMEEIKKLLESVK